MKEYTDIDPFGEEDWEEVDYQTFKEFGYFFDHELKTTFIEKYDITKKDKYFNNFKNLSTKYIDLMRVVNNNITNEIIQISRNQIFYKTLRLQVYIKSFFGLGFKLKSYRKNPSSFFINPFKEYFVNFNTDTLTFNVSKKYKLNKTKNIEVYDTNNTITSKFNIFNSRKAIKNIMKLYKNRLDNSININNKKRKEISKVQGYNIKYI